MLRLLSNHEGHEAHEGLKDFEGPWHGHVDIRSTGRPAKQASDEAHIEQVRNFVFFVNFVANRPVILVVPRTA